jgi:hypothetical protein
MYVKLTDQQRQALATRERPLRLFDEQTNTTYVLVREDVYQQIKALFQQIEAEPWVGNNGAPAAGQRPALSPGLLAIKNEIITYRRELSRLLDEGHEGRVALIKGDQVISIWDTFEDAYQAGRERFGLDVFIAQPIDPRDQLRVFPKELDPPEAV